MWHQIVEVFSLALFAIAMVLLEKRLPVPEDYRLLVASIIAVVGISILYGVYWTLRHSRWVRKLTDDLYAFEGDWLEEWRDGNSHRYSIATIRYDKKEKRYRLDGNTYDKDGKRTARWGGLYLFFDDKDQRLVHVWSGERNRKQTHGVTIVNTSDGNRRSGDGFFIDERPEGLKRKDFAYQKLGERGEAGLWQSDVKAWIEQHRANKKKSGRAAAS